MGFFVVYLMVICVSNRGRKVDFNGIIGVFLK